MKILMINHFPLNGSGSGVYTINTAKSLIKKGNEVCIIMPENISNYSKYDKIKLHPVYFLDKEYIEGQLPFNFPCFTTHPRSNNNFFDMSNKDIKMYIDAFYKAIKEEIEVFKPDIIHVQHIWILANIAVNFNIPTIITAHGTDIIGYERSDKFHKYTIDAIKKCKQIISISKDNKKLLLKNFPYAKNKITLIRNGYDETVFYEQTYDKKTSLLKLKINKYFDKIVCFAGKMTSIKGVDILLKACKIYEKENVATILAGNGELFDELKDMTRKLDLKNVYFLGNLNHDDLRMLYNISDVSIVPSRFEAFGLVAVEALACSTPVIASNVGGLVDIINNDVGVIVNNEDYIILAKKIEDVLDGKIKFIKNINKYAYKNYAQESLIDELINVYKKFI